MGWLYTQGQSKEELVKSCVSGSAHPTGFTALAHTTVGNHLWVVFENVESSNFAKGDRFICLYLLASHRGYGWGYKDMEESCGPYYFDCPLRYLNMVPEPPNTHRQEGEQTWREAVRAFHAGKGETRKKKEALKVDDILKLPEGCTPREAVIVSIDKTIIVRAINCPQEGKRYRMTPRFIQKATVVPATQRTI